MGKVQTSAPFPMQAQEFQTTFNNPITSPNMEALNNAEQQELQNRMEKRQMKDFMSLYSRLVDKCFNDCVDDFTSKSVSAREEGCIFRCWDKNMKSQERIQARFQEHNEAMMSQGTIQR